MEHPLNILFESLSETISSFLLDMGIEQSHIIYVNLACMLCVSAVLLYLSQLAAKFFVKWILNKSGKITKINFLTYLSQHRFHQRIAALLPFSVAKHLLPIVFEHFNVWIKIVDNILEIWFMYIILSVIYSIIQTFISVLRERPAYKHKPMDSYLQVIRMILILVGMVILFSTITGKSPTVFFAAMGAASAVLLLMFKDAIMGFVASIQVTTNDILRMGDWVTMPKYGADGDVLEINLTTVKIQNFDKTITTIPTYAFISDSFQNWRGMQESGGRRIKRAIFIKQETVRFIGEDELDEFKKIQGIAEYIDNKAKEIDDYNKKNHADKTNPVNGRNLTNIGLFRKYAEWYVAHHHGINKEMTLIVRLLDPTPKGLPIELYTFSNTTDWKEYENIMGDIFDHLIVAVRYFGLAIFEDKSN